MMMWKNPVFWLALLSVQACSSPESTQQLPPVSTVEKVAPPKEVKLEPNKAIAPQTFMMSGQLVLSGEQLALIPCNSEQQLWVNLSDSIRSELLSLVKSSNQPVYGELVGYLATTPTQGGGADFLATFNATQLNRLDKSSSCSVKQGTMIVGKENAWLAEFNQTGLSIKLADQPEVSLPIKATTIQDNVREYRVQGGTLRLEQAICKPSQTDTVLGWRAHLDLTKESGLSGEQLQGCAALSNIDATLNWTGHYAAKSTDNQAFSISLTLNQDHSAKTIYRYQGNQADITERGYWQQISPNQIQVVMTHHQQQRLVTERLFKGDGFTLHAPQERVGNVVYPIANGGITLFRTQQSSPPPKTASEPTSRTLKPIRLAASSKEDNRVRQSLLDYFTMHRTSPKNTKYQWLTYDLNGDGQQELLAKINWCQGSGCTLLVFENYQGKWRFNSRLVEVDGPIYVNETVSFGWHSLHTSPTRFSYDGISYRKSNANASDAETNAQSVVLFADQTSPHQGFAL